MNAVPASTLPTKTETETTPANDQRALKWRHRLAVQRRLRLLARLSKMPPGELAQRLRLAALKRLPGRAQAESERSRRRTAQAGEALAELSRDDLAVLLEKGFLFAPQDLPALRTALRAEPMAKAAAATVAAADTLLAGRVELLGQNMRLVPGAAMDWQADPLSGQRVWPDDGLDEGAAIGHQQADAKYVWELNRQQFLPTLGRAYVLTGDPRYARFAADLLDSWLAQNPYRASINWCSHLEVGMRAISWLWTLPLLLSWPQLDDNLLRRWLFSLGEHYQHLADNLSVYTDPTNHLIGETTALWMLAGCFPQLPDAAMQTARTEQLLLVEFDRQVLSDGVNVEQASSYHRFVLDFYLQFAQLSERRGRPLVSSARLKLERMFAYTADLAGSTGIAPMTGDSDDARALPLLELLGWDFRDSVACGALACRRSDWARQARALAEVGVWLFGATAPADFAELVADNAGKIPEPQPSRLYTAGGGCFLRAQKNTGSGVDEVELIFNTGPFGLWPNAAHAHADALSIQLRVNGCWLLTDPGTGTYFGDPELRDRLRASTAHSTVTVDRFDQADKFDVFKWVNPPSRHFDASDFCFDAPIEHAAAGHGGYRRLRRPVDHYRRVLNLGDGSFVIIDQLSGNGEHHIEQHFAFHPDAQLSRVGAQTVVAEVPGIVPLRLNFLELDGVTLQCDNDGVWSGGYGRCQSAPRLSLSVSAELPLTRLCWLELGADGNRNGDSDEACRVEHRAGGGVLYRRCAAGVSVDATREQWLLLNPNGAEQNLGDGLRSAARLVYLEFHLEGGKRQPIRAFSERGELFGTSLPTTAMQEFFYYG